MSLHPAPMGPPPHRASRSLFGWALLTIPLWLGCADPDGKFDEFVERTEMNMPPKPDAGPPMPTVDGGVTPDQITGSYLSVTSTNVSPTKPVVYRLEVTAEQTSEGKLQLTLVDQPLAYWDRKTPVGPKSAPRSVVVDDNGTYTEILMGVVTPKDANPVTYQESTSDTTFYGNVGAAEIDAASNLVMFWCGTMAGKIYQPAIPFTGTFTTTRIVDENNYPDAVINCAKDPADAPPPRMQ